MSPVAAVAPFPSCSTTYTTRESAESTVRVLRERAGIVYAVVECKKHCRWWHLRRVTPEPCVARKANGSHSR